VRDLYFEDQTSLVRYFVIDTGGWLPGRRVLLAPAAFGMVDHEERKIVTALTRRQVEDSPGAETDQPVSRAHEDALHSYYGWDPYWYGATAAAAAPYWGGMALATMPPPAAPDSVERDLAEAGRERGDPHLRSAHEVVGYYVAATDGDIGHVEDLLIDDARWAVRQLVIDTRNWLPGKKVLVGPERLRSVDWGEQHIVLDLSRDQVKASPEYDPATTVPA
jgi:hypothetical protein